MAPVGVMPVRVRVCLLRRRSCLAGKTEIPQFATLMPISRLFWSHDRQSLTHDRDGVGLASKSSPIATTVDKAAAACCQTQINGNQLAYVSHPGR